ncbi:hypothetical protein AAHB58_16680 [Enterobacter hormaechei]
MKKLFLLGMVLPVLSGCVIKEQTRYVESPVATNPNNATNNPAGAVTKNAASRIIKRQNWIASLRQGR